VTISELLKRSILSAIISWTLALLRGAGVRL
jgi:hypothetical protein